MAKKKRRKAGATVGDAAVRSVEAMEKVGASVQKGVESLSKDVRKAADAALTAATGAASYVYPELVKRRKMLGAQRIVSAACCFGVSLTLVGVLAVLIAFGLSVSESDPMGCVRFGASIAVVIPITVFASIGMHFLGESSDQQDNGWADYFAPEGRVLWDLLDRFTKR